VVSAVHRSFKAGDRMLFDFVQTDASINPGNSGGALLDIEGRLVGINTAILGDRNAGIGFAIPIDRARRIAEDLIAHGAVREGYVGIAVDDLPAKDGRADASGGVVVTSVDPGSPAERAGVRRGDHVDSVQGFTPQSAEEFRFRVRDLAVGSTARLEVTRGGSRVHVQVAAVELSPERVSELVARRTGLTLTEERVRGGPLVVVRAVARGSPAARVGVQAGDLVREVNSTEVSTLAEFRRAASRARRSGELVLLVQRGFAAERIAFGID
jgi:S1-C subfamily serine protease